MEMYTRLYATKMFEHASVHIMSMTHCSLSHRHESHTLTHNRERERESQYHCSSSCDKWDLQFPCIVLATPVSGRLQI